MKKRVYSGIPVLRQFVGYGNAARAAARTAGGEAPSPAACEEKAFAFAADTGVVALPDGGPFPLAGGLYCAGGFRGGEGWVTIEREGTYLAVFTVSGRADTAPLPAVCLETEEGGRLGAPVQLLAAEDGGVQGTGSAVLEAKSGTRLRLRAEGPLLLTGTPAATLTILREV